MMLRDLGYNDVILTDDSMRNLIINHNLIVNSCSHSAIKAKILTLSNDIYDVSFIDNIRGAGSSDIYIYCKNESSSLLESCANICSMNIPAGLDVKFLFPGRKDIFMDITVILKASISLSKEIELKSLISKEINNAMEEYITRYDIEARIKGLDGNISKVHINKILVNGQVVDRVESSKSNINILSNKAVISIIT